MRRILAAVAILAGIALSVAIAPAQTPSPFADFGGGPGADSHPLALRTIVSKTTVTPGGTLHVAVRIGVAESFYVYGPYAGGTARNLTVRAETSALRPGEPLYAPTRRHVTAFPNGTQDINYVYETTGTVWVPVAVPANLPTGRYDLPLLVEGQLCTEDSCIAVDEKLTAPITVGDADVDSPDWTADLRDGLARAKTAEQWKAALTAPPDKAELEPIQYEVFGGSDVAEKGVLTGLGLAWLAGLLLNIMPCVLPVLPLRLLTLLNQAGQSRRRFVGLGLAFAFGVFLFFVAIGAANAGLKSVFDYSLTWGDLFRHPEIVTGLALLLTALAANMFGLFELTLPGRVAEARAGAGVLGAVGMGFLVAVLATPCSGAVLAAAFTWAQFQPLWVGTVALATMGLGMAAPHALIAFFPQIVSRLPRAGAWTGLFKDFVGFVLLMIAAWLIGSLAPTSNVGWVLGFAVVLGMCLWMWGKWVGYTTPPRRKWAARIAAVVLAVAAGTLMLSPPGTWTRWFYSLTGDKGAPLKMIPFNRAEIKQARQRDKTVLVKFTANWCAECKIVQMTVYDRPAVAEALHQRGVMVFEGDVTTRDMPAGGMLYHQLGQSGPPLAAIFPPGSDRAILLRGGYDKDDLVRALDYADRVAHAVPATPEPPGRTATADPPSE
ncbi:MAG TPA: cytochrome c biogenesis protein CcdA [Phycisphaerae bacterium]|nr:cytochrome c biogenesis protein CcdA [Phycisphaerae bacterium]